MSSLSSSKQCVGQTCPGCQHAQCYKLTSTKCIGEKCVGCPSQQCYTLQQKSNITNVITNAPIVKETHVQAAAQAPIINEQHVVREKHILREQPVIEKTIVHQQDIIQNKQVIHEKPIIHEKTIVHNQSQNVVEQPIYQQGQTVVVQEQATVIREPTVTTTLSQTPVVHTPLVHNTTSTLPVSHTHTTDKLVHDNTHTSSSSSGGLLNSIKNVFTGHKDTTTTASTPAPFASTTYDHGATGSTTVVNNTLPMTSTSSNVRSA